MNWNKKEHLLGIYYMCSYHLPELSWLPVRLKRELRPREGSGLPKVTQQGSATLELGARSV